MGWQESYRNRYTPLIVFESSSNGDLTGLIPLAVENRSGRVTLAGGHQAEYQGWLSLPSQGGSFLERALRLLELKTNTGLLCFRYLPPETPVDWIARSGGMPWICKLESHRRPIIRLGSAAEVAEYLQKKKKRKSTRNYWNRLKRYGDLRLERILEPGELALVFDKLIAYHDIRQGGTHGKFAFENDAAKKPFHLALLSVPNLLHVTILKAGHRIISAEFGVSHRGAYCGVFPLFSPFEAANSPMTVHLLMLVEQLHAEGYSILDLTAGSDPFKERFAADYDSVHSLSIYFKRGVWVRQQIRRKGEGLARRILHSLRIAPNSAREHWDWIRRAPLGVWRFSAARLFSLLCRKIRSGAELSIYELEAEQVWALEDSCLMCRDRLDDLLAFEPAEIWRTRQRFLAESLRKIESGHHFYTRVENGRLAHVGWLVENQRWNDFSSVTGFQFPPESALVYASYTEPRWRGRGLCQSALRQMLHDAVRSSPAVQRIFVALSGDDEAARHIVAKLGFREHLQGELRRCAVSAVNEKRRSGIGSPHAISFDD
jgi:CelD/BcsL family acetyltransferase involved in cellulose biosynthesis/RimJ/RimL family protein N-acetyltransferase